MAVKAKSEPLRLSYAEKGRQVFVEPENEDRFLLTVNAAIEACREGDNVAKFKDQFRELLDVLATWIIHHGQEVKDAYVSVRDADLLFLVVRKSKAYDRSFEDELTDLDLQVAHDKDLNLIRLSVLALPKTSKDVVDSFLRPDWALRFPHAG